MQATFNQIVAGKNRRTFCVVLAPTTTGIPIELQKVFVCLEHHLPDRTALEEIARHCADEDDELPKGPGLSKLLDAAAGLTRSEAEGAFTLSLARKGKIDPEEVWELKSGALAKSGLATLYRGGTYNFANLRGFDHLRVLAKQLLRPGCPVLPKGWILFGAPGCGKTSVAKAIADDNGMPLIMGDLGSLKGGLVGESEAKVRGFVNLCESMAPAIVLLDEIEDALAGATSEHVGDTGVARDQLATILKWRSESQARVFLIGTCNNPEAVMKVKEGAFTRDGRFDGMVFVDLPDRATKDMIWELYRKKYGLVPGPVNPDDEGWSPANIEVCCQRAVQYEISLAEAALYVRPNDPTSVERLRNWANGRCLNAAAPGMYTKPGSTDNDDGFACQVDGKRRSVKRSHN